MKGAPSATELASKNLACGYPDREVLRDIGFELGKGEILALLGRNGSGKSTLLRTLVGEIKPIRGEIWIGGVGANTLSARERAQKLGFVPSEERTEFAFLSRELVAMGRIPQSDGLFDTQEDKRICEEALQKVECLDLADRPITTLSAGEHQRVLLARALAQQAPILLLDEPTSHLDPGHQVSFVQLVRQLAARGLSVIVALHDLNLTAHLADRAILLDDGGVSFQGSASEVLESSELDEAYGTRFERFKGPDGLVRLSPFPSLRS